MATISSAKNTRKTIGLLTSCFNSQVSMLEWQGVMDAAKELDVNLITYDGEVIKDIKDFKYQSNILYDLISRDRIDGLIIWSAMLDWYINTAEMEIFIKRFAPIPIVSAETAFPGIPSILMDDYEGMREAMTHLVSCHQRRDIVFIKGPDGHLGVQERFRAYKDVLTEHGIPVNENLITAPSTWDAESATRLLHKVIDDYQAPFDAVVAPSERLVLGAIECLKKRGMSIPDEVSLIGFDDTEVMDSVIPSITTTYAPLYEIGKKAAHVLAALIDGKAVADRIFVPTRLVIRQSCGCVTPLIVNPPASTDIKNISSIQFTLEQALAASQQEFMERIGKANNCELRPDLYEKLCTSFIAASMQDSTEATDAFLKVLDFVMQRVFLTKGNTPQIDKVILYMHSVVEPYMHQKDAHSQFDHLYQQARLVMLLAAQRFKTFSVIDAKRLSDKQTEGLQEIGSTLISTTSTPEIMNILSNDIWKLNINSCYISVYEDPINPLGSAKLLLAHSSNTRIPIDSSFETFSAHRLLPDKIFPSQHRFNLLVQSLYFRDSQIGLVIHEAGATTGFVFEVLRGLISSALHSALLVERVNEGAANLQRANDTLQRSMDELVQTQAELVLKQRDLELANKEITELSNHDLLTGMLNRRAIEQELSNEKKRSDRYDGGNSKPFTVLFIDLDNFKFYNDTFGHDAGDATLQAFSSLLSDAIRSTDQVARFGGDEFIVLLAGTSTAGAIKLATKIVGRLKAEKGLCKRISTLLQRDIFVEEKNWLSCSSGIATYQPGKDLSSLLKSADKALYHAKKKGKGCYFLADDLDPDVL